MTSSDSLFQCTQCGDCCKGFGGTYVNESEIRTISDFINETVPDFIRRYCAPSGNRWVLAQGRDGYCVFYSRNCTIHPVKPRMCRRWPFIDSLLVDISNWYIMARSCPGMQTDIDETHLKKCLHEILKDAHPD